MIIDCISDLHGFYPELEGGDLLIVAGDLTARDLPEEYLCFGEWIRNSKYKYKIVVAGNHDCSLHKSYFHSDPPEKSSFPKMFINPFILFGADYLCDSGTEFEGLKIWGSPWTKTFPGMNPHCKAFTVDTEDELADKYEYIPHDIDILITHSPPFGVGDGIDKLHDGSLFHVGSKSLFGWFKYVIRPKLHVFGHIHEGYGQYEVFLGYNDTMVKSINASHVNEKYQPVNPPIRIIL